MVTTKEESIVNTQKIKIKGIKPYNHKKSPNHKGRQEEREKRTKVQQNSQKTINKMAIVSPYLLITTLNINGLKFSMKIQNG